MIRCLYTGKRTTAKRRAAQIINEELNAMMYWDCWETEEMTPKNKDKIMVELNKYHEEIMKFVDPHG